MAAKQSPSSILSSGSSAPSIEHGGEQLRPAVAVRLPAGVCELDLKSDVYVLAVARWSIEGLQAVEKLAFAAARLEKSANELTGNDAERLASACARHGQDSFEGKMTVDIDSGVLIADDRLFGQLEIEFEEYVEDVRRQNADRADLQLNNLERHLTNQRQQMLRVRDQHASAGADSLVKATEGRIRALENRIEQRRLKIEKNRVVRHRNDEVLASRS